jgi:hypothetical protein
MTAMMNPDPTTRRMRNDPFEGAFRRYHHDDGGGRTSTPNPLR